jgi:hypothetical protein
MPQYVRVCPPLVSFLHGTVKFTYKNLLSLCAKELEFWKERWRSRLSQSVLQQQMFLTFILLMWKIG